LRKNVRCEEKDPEVCAILDASNESLEWVAEEFAGVDLHDKRLDRRLVKTAEHLARSPSSPINEACGSWADTQGAYRLFDNAKASPEAILKPHIAETAKRIVAHGGPVLVIQDTVFFSYGQHPKTKRIGPIGKSNSVHERGLIMHNALAFTTSGVPLGILSQRIWARGAVPEEGAQEKIERLQCTPIEEKESSKWLLGLNETLERAPSGVRLVTVADRESDFFEFLTEAQEQGADYLLRARTNRKLLAEESEGYDSLLEALTTAEVLGVMSVEIPGNGQRKARRAEVEVRVVQVMIKPPQRRGKAQATTSMEPISVAVIGVTEPHPPAGQEALSWVLLTNLPVPTIEAAAEKIGWYTKRFGIEIWHKVLKSGCKVEDCLLETGERLARYLTLFSILGVRLMYVAYLARVQPEQPASDVFSHEEIEALHVRLYKTLPPAESISLREAVRMLGRIGGHLGRKCDGEPGMTVIWRGWMRLHEDVMVIRSMKHACGLKASD
jgi:hypothetical protein